MMKIDFLRRIMAVDYAWKDGLSQIRGGYYEKTI